MHGKRTQWLSPKSDHRSEDHFHLNGFVNEQIIRFWGTQNPRVVHSRLHFLKVTVWWNVTSERITGPYFLGDNEGNAVTVAGARYCEMLQQSISQQFAVRLTCGSNNTELLLILLGTLCSDRETCFKTASSSQEVPTSTALPIHLIWVHLISCFGDTSKTVHKNIPQDVHQSKENLEFEIHAQERNTLTSVMQNMLKRAQLCETENNCHLQDINFHK